MIIATDFDTYVNTDRVTQYVIESEIIPNDPDNARIWTLTAYFSMMHKTVIAKGHYRQDVASKLDAILQKINRGGV